MQDRQQRTLIYNECDPPHPDPSPCCATRTSRPFPRRAPSVTLGLYRNRSAVRIKGNQATFDNSQRNNLRSCLWGLFFVEWVFGAALSSSPSRILPSYIVFLGCHVVPLENPYLLSFSQETRPPAKAPEPHGLGPHNLLALVGLTISRLIPAPRKPL